MGLAARFFEFLSFALVEQDSDGRRGTAQSIHAFIWIIVLAVLGPPIARLLPFAEREKYTTRFLNASVGISVLSSVVIV